jgi:AcrR family transcriptional regulator
MALTDPTALADRLLDAAEIEVSMNGVAGFSLRATARRAGVSHQAPIHHFGSAAGMLTALAARGFQTLAEVLTDAESAVSTDASAEHLLEAIGNAYVDFGTRRPALFAAMFRPATQFVANDELTVARVKAFAVLKRCVERATAAGWASGYDNEMLLFASWAVVHGTVMLWRDGTSEIFFPNAELSDIGRRVTRALVAAFGEA